jgi:RNA recognition motif-containing protein
MLPTWTGDRARLFCGIRTAEPMMETKPIPHTSRTYVLKKIYVGNLSFTSNDHDLTAMFTQYGDVTSAKVITDRDTGRSRGFGFVEMADDQSAMQAIQAVNGQEIDGRTLNVNEARPREQRSSRW